MTGEPPSTQEHPEPAKSEGPAVGNILGFSLLFRERRALVALQRRSLAPGLRARDYEAEIPGVEFPIKGPLSASRFRNHRCRAVRLTTSVEERAITPWLQHRWVGKSIETSAGKVRVTKAIVELRRELPGTQAATGPGPVVQIEGRTESGAFAWLMVALRLTPVGRLLRLEPWRMWWVSADAGVVPAELWCEAARRLRHTHVHVDPDGSVLVDPAGAVAHRFVAVGWKAPDLQGLGIETASLTRRALTVELRADLGPDAAPSALPSTEDPVTRALAEIRSRVSQGEHSAALDILTRLDLLTVDFPAARLAIARTRVEVSRFRDRAACLRAVRDWLDLQPRSIEAHRLLSVLLALEGQPEELARLLAGERRLDRTERMELQGELAIASLLVDHLDDPRSALATVSPVVARLRDEGPDTPLYGLLPESLVVLAQARAAQSLSEGRRSAPHARSALDEALALTDTPALRAQMRARVARCFARYRLSERDQGALAQGLELLSAAIGEYPDDPALMDQAVDMSLQLGERESAAELLTLRLERASDNERDAVRRRLIIVLAGLDSPHRQRALAELQLVLEADPEAAEMIDLASRLEAEDGQYEAAADHVSRLLELGPAAANSRERLTLRHATLLRQAGRIDEAWESLRGLLASIDGVIEPTAQSLALVELALELAPPTDRPQLLDQLIDVADGQRRGDALLERAAQTIDVDARLRDLWDAVEVLPNPRAVLAQIEQITADEDADGLGGLAKFASRHGDTATEARARARLGNLFSERGDLEHAIPQLRRALDLEPGRADVEYTLGRCLAALGSLEDAARHLTVVLGNDDLDGLGIDRAPLVLLAARLWHESGGTERAVDLLEGTEAALPAEARLQASELRVGLLLDLQRDDEAKRLALELAERYGDEPSAAASWLHRAAQLEPEPQSRLELLGRAHSLDPNARSIDGDLLAVLRELGRSEELERLLRARLQGDGESLPQPTVRIQILAELTTMVTAQDDLAELHRALLELDPGRVDSLFGLAQIEADRGAKETALELWTRALAHAADSDPRLLEPSIALAIAAEDAGDLEQARSLAERGLSLDPRRREHLELLVRIGRRIQDATLRRRGSEGLLELGSEVDAQQRAALCLDLAKSLRDLGDGEAASDALERGASLAEPASVVQLEIAEVWLELARELERPPLEARARAEMRRALGPDLPLDDLVSELRLLSSLSERREDAEALLRTALATRDAPDPMLEAAVLLLPDPEARAELLGEALDVLEPGAGRDRVAFALAELGRDTGDAALVLHALDRHQDPANSSLQILELREWAIRDLGMVTDELDRIEAELMTAEADFESRLGSLARLAPSPIAGATRMLELADRASGELVVAALVGATLQVAPLLEAGDARRIAIDALAHLALRGAAGELAHHWVPVEEAVVAAEDPKEIAGLVRVAAMAARLGPRARVAARAADLDRADALLNEFLPRMPDSPELMGALWDQLNPHDVAPPRDATQGSERLLSDSAKTEQIQRVADHLDNLAGAAEARAELLDGLADMLPADTAGPLLLGRALAHPDDLELCSAILARLRRRHRWPEVAALLTHLPSEGAESWLELAESAARDDDTKTEARARARAGLLLLESDDEAGNNELAEQAAEQMARSLELDPGQPALRYSLGLARQRYGDLRGAMQVLLGLVEREEWSAAGVELGALATRCGRLLLAVGAQGDVKDPLGRAIELLRIGHARSSGPHREQIAVELHGALTRAGEREQASRHAASMATESSEESMRLEWLRLAAKDADGGRQVELLQRAHRMAPKDPDIDHSLERALREVGDHRGLENLLRERVAADAGLPALRSLLDLIHEDPRADERLDEIANLYRKIIELDPGDVDALLALAGHYVAGGHMEQATAIWRRVESLLDREDPRFAEPARLLAQLALRDNPPSLERARGLLERVLVLAPDDVQVLEQLREVAIALDDPALWRRALQGLLAGPAAPERALSLHRESATCLARLDRIDEAITQLQIAVGLAEPRSPTHRDLAHQWLDLVEGAALAGDSEAIRQESQARAEHRAAFGRDTTTDAVLREVDLLEALQRLDPAFGLLEEFLLERPVDGEGALLARNRLAKLADEHDAHDRRLRTLRRVVDGLDPGPVRDDLARDLARGAREHDAARTALAALERLSGESAGDSEMLDLREWAVRKLGKVEDELHDIEDSLVTEGCTALTLTRLMRMLEQDAEACAARLLDLAEGRAEGEIRKALIHESLELVRSEAPDRLGLALRSLSAWVENGGGPTPHWEELSELVLARDAPSRVDELLQIADAGERSPVTRPPFQGRSRRLLHRALLRWPEHAALHAAGLRRLERELGQNGDPVAAMLGEIEALALREGSPDPAVGRSGPDHLLGRLFLGLASALPHRGAQLLRELAEQNAPREALYALLRDGLRSRHAWSELVTLYERIGAEPAQWATLAGEIGRGAESGQETGGLDPDVLGDLEGRARTQAGMGLLAAAATTQARANLERARALRPDDAPTQYGLGCTLAGMGDHEAALEQLLPLVDDRRHGQAGVELGALARLCALSLMESGDHGQALKMLALAHGAWVDEPELRLEVAKTRFELLEKADRRDEARVLAEATAEELAGDARAEWLIAAARLSSLQSKARLLVAAHHLRPADTDLADQLEEVLSEVGDHHGLEMLLRTRIEGEPRGADSGQFVARLERLVELQRPGDATARAPLLERILRQQPDHVDARIDLGRLRLAEGDRQAATTHWRHALTQLGDGDPRGVEPALALADVLLEAGHERDLDEARALFERAAATGHADHGQGSMVWHGLLAIGRRQGDHALVLRASNELLERSDLDDAERTALGLSRARALSRTDRTLEAVEAAAAAFERAKGTDLALECAELWVELALRPELEATPSHEAKARAALRGVLGPRTPSAALRAEATVLATRLDRLEAAVDLLQDALEADPSRIELLDSLEDLCTRAQASLRLLAALLAIVDRCPPGPLRDDLDERRALVARRAQDAASCLDALSRLGHPRASRPELVELREWAVRALGRVGEELDVLENELLQAPSPEERERLSERLLRFLDGKGELLSQRLLDLRDRGPIELRGELARMALDAVRRHAPSRLQAALDGLEAVRDEHGIDTLALWWADIEKLALERGQLEDLVRLLQLAADAEAHDALAYGNRADRLLAAAIGSSVDDPRLHELVRTRIERRLGELDPGAVVEASEALARQCELKGPELARFYGAALSFLEPRARGRGLLQRAKRHGADAPTLQAFVELLEQGEHWEELLELHLASAERGQLDAEALRALAEAAAKRGLRHVEHRALATLGRHYVETEDAEAAVTTLSSALRSVPEELEATAAVMQLHYWLGTTLRNLGRPDAALEHLLQVTGTGTQHDTPTLAQHCGLLLVEVGDRERGAQLLRTALDMRVGSVLSSQQRRETQASLFEALESLGHEDEAREIAQALAEEDPDEGWRWLLEAAKLAQGPARIEGLAAALERHPDPALADRLEEELRAAGDVERLEQHLQRQFQSALVGPEADRARASNLSRKLVNLLAERADEAPEALAEAWESLLRLEPEDLDALLGLAEVRWRAGNEQAAAQLWNRAAELLVHDDDRFFEPARRLATIAQSSGDHAQARSLLERALDTRPGDHETLERLLGVAKALEDWKLIREVSNSLLAHEDGSAARAQLELTSAQASQVLGEPVTALEAYERAARLAPSQSPLHVEIARAWVELTREAGGSLGDDRAVEAAARRALREAAGDAISESDLRAEARLLVDLGQVDQGLALIEAALEGPRSSSGDQELLLSEFKDLCLLSGEARRYVAAVERAMQSAADRGARDRLAIELAYSAVEIDDAQRLLQVLESMSPEQSSAPEMLDLREWAIRKLGRVKDEVGEIDRRLLFGEDAHTLVPRMLRMLDQDVETTATHLLELSQRADDPKRSRNIGAAVLDLCRNAPPSVLPVALETMARIIDWSAAEDPPVEIERSWSAVEKLALELDDAGKMAALMALGWKAVDLGVDLHSRLDELMRVGLIRHPEHPKLHQVTWDRLSLAEPAGPDEDPVVYQNRIVSLMSADLEGLEAKLELPPERRADLWVGLCGLLDRRHGAELLVERARLEMANPGAFRTLVAALEEQNHWAHVLELLEGQVDSEASDDEARVAALKELGHVCAEVLGDPEAAIGHLERALALAPQDPDLLLPLLDHHYSQPQLERAIELSSRVLEHVPMGAVAFTALAHRAGDAALAHGDPALAEALLTRALERSPDDTRTRSRLQELSELAGSPEHRVRMLAAVAHRQSGSSRLEALEERARLLVELGRLEEAITDLEAVVGEAPQRTSSIERLAELYEEREHWTELADLLEREFPRTSGRARAEKLHRIAVIQRDRLFDLPRADEALRLALEALQEPDDLDEERADLDFRDTLHAQLAACLELQGRHAEIVAHLEEELRPDLEGSREPGPRRCELMVVLARMLKDKLEDEQRAAKVYARLEDLGQLPEEGLATLARFYRRQHLYDDLVRILIVRSTRLAELGEDERKAEVDFRIAELLEGPLRRPHEAARFYLDAYLTNPGENPTAGARARVLLAGTDSVVNVRRRLVQRLEELDESFHPALLTLLGDLLAPHDSHEEEAEQRYREALTHDPELAVAHEGLGRLMARQGRLDEAVDPLVRAASSAAILPARAADDAATAARVLLELERPEEAEHVLKQALGRAPDAQRALLELARLYERVGREADQAATLDDLSQLPLSSMLRAEVAYRRAMLLESEFEHEPLSEAGEQARAYLLEAVGADAMHAQARQVLLELATARSEWSIVAHMHFLGIRELQPGTQRALIHLDLAEVYHHRLHDSESAVRNLASAVQQAGDDVVVFKRAVQLAERLPRPIDAAKRIEKAAQQAPPADTPETSPLIRARMGLLAAELYRRGNELDAAEGAAQAVLELHGVPEEVLGAAARHIQDIGESGADLESQRRALIGLVESEQGDLERLQVLGRLRDVARALGDDELVERSSRMQLELVVKVQRGEHDSDDAAAARDAAVAALRDLLAERGDYQSIVDIYEQLADETSDPAQAAELLADAARFAWTGLRDARVAVGILRRSLELHPTLPAATAVLGEISGYGDDPDIDKTICDELSQVTVELRPPVVSLRLAEAALRLEQQDRARSFLDDLLAREGASELRLQALSLLADLLARSGLAVERLQVQRERLDLTRTFQPDRASEAALGMAQTQRALGSLDDARATCEQALEDQPSHLGLTHMLAELLDQAEDWPALSSTLEHLAHLSIDPEKQAHWLTRAAQVHLDHGQGDEVFASARRLLLRARSASRNAAEPRSVLLPLAFVEGRLDEVLDLAVELRALDGDDNEALMYAALVEAVSRGKRTLARAIGSRHEPEIRARTLWPAAARLLEQLAHSGPLPRLDALLGAAAALTGGTERLSQELGAWAAGQPPAAGISLGLARLQEAFGRMDQACHLYQLAAFLAPEGPVVSLCARLPSPGVPEDPLHREGWVPLEWRGALREVLIQLREHLAGIRGGTGAYAPAESALERATIQTAGRVVGRWRSQLGIPIPIRLTHDWLQGGVGVRNEPDPIIVVNPSFMSAPEAERNFRLALAASIVATGVSIAYDTHPVDLADLVDALMTLAKPRHEVTTEGGGVIADTLASQGLNASQLDSDLRASLTHELQHWAGNPQRLRTASMRACLLLATRLGGSLDGALQALTRDHGLQDRSWVLRTDDARWLLRTLGLFD